MSNYGLLIVIRDTIIKKANPKLKYIKGRVSVLLRLGLARVEKPMIEEIIFVRFYSLVLTLA